MCGYVTLPKCVHVFLTTSLPSFCSVPFTLPQSPLCSPSLCRHLQAAVHRAGSTAADLAEGIQGQQASVHGERGTPVEAAQLRPEQPTPPIAHLALSLAPQLGRLPHSPPLPKITPQNPLDTHCPALSLPKPQPWAAYTSKDSTTSPGHLTSRYSLKLSHLKLFPKKHILNGLPFCYGKALPLLLIVQFSERL